MGWMKKFRVKMVVVDMDCVMGLLDGKKDVEK